ncbi:MAG: FtsX-like permease family protein [Candidatus Berkelbacteria bacterium]
MGTIIRGFKNAFRNSIRTISIVLILSISIAMALVMLESLKTVQGKIDSVKSSIGNTINVSPAGMRGFEGGGTLLTAQNASDIKTISHVTQVVETLSGRLTTIGVDTSSNPFGRNESTSTNAQTSLTAPPVERPAGDTGSGRVVANGQDVTGKTFSMPITVTGINDLSNLSALNATSFTIESGSKIDASSSANEALVGKALASKNNLTAGGTFTAYGQTITAKGIFDAGNTFANGGIIMPIATVQNLSSQSGQIDSIIVTTDSIDSLSSTQTAIKDKLGTSVDVTTSEQSAQSAVTPLENIKSISLYSLIGALVAGSIIIFLTMVMIVRERRREIGVLKAIGASNISIVSQFSVESLVLTLTSSVVGMILGVILSNPILNVLVNNSSSTTSTAGAARGGFGGPGGQAVMRFAGGAGNAVRNLHAAVGWQIILYGLGAAVIIAIIGSALPAFFISKVRPSEVLRSE